MRLLTLLSLFVFLSISTVQAQQNEVGVFGGASFFSGDLIESSVDFKELNIGYGAFYRFYFSPKFSLKFGLNGGTFTGDDANSTTLTNRGLSFKSSIYDINANAEWNFLGLNVHGSTAKVMNRFSPFISIGVGAAYYSVEVTENNPDSPLKVYDASHEYPAMTMIVPFGVGVKYVTNSLTIAIEGSARAGLTDFLDGVSKSGNPTDNDWFSYAGISVAYRLGGTSRGSSSQSTPDENIMNDEMIEENPE